jgi:hypothetical protein
MIKTSSSEFWNDPSSQATVHASPDNPTSFFRSVKDR